MKKQHLFAGIIGGIFLLAGWALWSSQTTTGIVTVNEERDIAVAVASRTLAQHRGLSGIAQGDFRYDGMLFVFSDAKVRHFWMKGMQFPLDIVWLQNGKIVAIDKNVPPPLSRSDEPARVSSNPISVDAVLELPGGKAEEYDLFVGSILKFSY